MWRKGLNSVKMGPKGAHSPACAHPMVQDPFWKHTFWADAPSAALPLLLWWAALEGDSQVVASQRKW